MALNKSQCIKQRFLTTIKNPSEARSFLPLTLLALLLTILRIRGRLPHSLALLPSRVTLQSRSGIIHPFLILVRQLHLVLLTQASFRAIQLCCTLLLCLLLLLLRLKPCPLWPGHDLRLVLHQVLTLGDLHLSLRELFLCLLFFENLVDFLLHVLSSGGPGVSDSRVDDAGGNLGALRFAGLHGGFDDLAVWLSGDGAGTTGAARTGGTTDSVEIDLVVLGSFVVNDGFDAFDIKTTGGQICG